MTARAVAGRREERGADSRQLWLLRHAKSSWDDPRLADHDRPLAPRGRHAGELMASHLRRRGIAPGLVLCSTSVRTRETLALVAPALDGPTVLFERGLYGASADSLLARLQRLRHGVRSVMLIAHSSGIEDLALLLAMRGAQLDAVRRKFPTGALATLELGGEWSSLGPRCADLVEFVTPRALEGV